MPHTRSSPDRTLALLPPYSPELNPVERVWLYLRERFLSLRVLDDTEEKPSTKLNIILDLFFQ